MDWYYLYKRSNQPWDPHFYRKFAGYASILPLWEPEADSFTHQFPTPQDFNQLAHRHQVPDLQFVEQGAKMSYEQMIFQENTVPMRLDHWHDFFNNVTWLTFPRMKRALVEHYVHENNGDHRTSMQNVLAHVDECGIVICSSNSDYFEMIQQHQWKTLFWESRFLIDECQPFIIGHGLLEKCLQPYIGITGKALFLKVASSFFQMPYTHQLTHIDQTIAERIIHQDFPRTPRALSPFPFLGWPGWHEGNRCAAFYDNLDYFRPKSQALTTA